MTLRTDRHLIYGGLARYTMICGAAGDIIASYDGSYPVPLGMVYDVMVRELASHCEACPVDVLGQFTVVDV